MRRALGVTSIISVPTSGRLVGEMPVVKKLVIISFDGRGVEDRIEVSVQDRIVPTGVKNVLVQSARNIRWSDCGLTELEATQQEA